MAKKDTTVPDNTVETSGLSEEWLGLVELAMESNVTKEEFKEFLKESNIK